MTFRFKSYPRQRRRAAGGFHFASVLDAADHTPALEGRHKPRIAGFSPFGKRPAMEKWETKIDVNSEETIVSPKEDADELYRCLVLIEGNHDIRAFLTRVFHGTDVRGCA